MTQEQIPLQSNEEIAPIQGYGGRYSITSFGRVWSHRRIARGGNNYRKIGDKFLKLGIHKQGYLQVRLCKEGIAYNHLVHVLESQAFISNPQKLPMVNHKDGNKQNNYAGTREKNFEDGNLEWCTSQENHNHAMVNKLTYKKPSEFYGVSYRYQLKNSFNKWRSFIRVNKKQINIGCFKTELEAAKAYNNYVIEYNLNRPLNRFIKKEGK